MESPYAATPGVRMREVQMANVAASMGDPVVTPAFSDSPEVRSGLLYPLDEFYRRAGLVVPRATRIAGDAMPEPYRRLLVHDRDMTPTLEAFHGERIHLRVIGRREDPNALSRLVVLAGKETGKGIEFGAIVIHLDPFPPEARALVLESKCPLGTILGDFQIAHQSHPEAYFQVATDSLVKGALDLTGPVLLYGRKNVMVTSGGAPLAEVVEILPPLELPSG